MFCLQFPNLTALDLLWCEHQQEGNVDQDVGDCDNREAQGDRPGRHLQGKDDVHSTIRKSSSDFSCPQCQQEFPAILHRPSSRRRWHRHSPTDSWTLQKMPTGGKLVAFDFSSHLKWRRVAGAKGDHSSNYDGLNQKCERILLLHQEHPSL